MPEVAERHALGALEARRELGDRERIALAVAAHADVMGSFGTFGDRSLEILLPAWEEFADLEATAAGVALMLEIARGYVHSDDLTAVAWVERALPVAERLDLLPQTATGLFRLSSALTRLGRPREALILLRGTHELAVANDLVDVDRLSRTTLTFYEQFAEPVPVWRWPGRAWRSPADEARPVTAS